MSLRITTWNVNGIRNPFSYQPWRDQRTFTAMFEILQADIVIMQELKIQRKDLKDDMVLVPGWDSYFSLPKHKKGYSGVAIYTRQAICAPIKAEEGIIGVLCPPNSSTCYCDLPEDDRIGGYPTASQLSVFPVDAGALDSEGRCVILEFPAFVLIGVYSPANSAGNRDEFRLGFLNALDSRVRNLVAEGKRVIVAGDLNVSRDGLDSANPAEAMRKCGLTIDEYISLPTRRMFNQLLLDGQVLGARDAGKEEPALWDICRGFHPTRKGMFTCWEQKINARPGNYGSRIDYVLCSLDMRDWFSDANIQEGLLGSDHCPVYAVLKDKVNVGGKQVHIYDLMNPGGMFKDGKRLHDYSLKTLPATSGRLIPEFDRRRTIRDMFSKKPCFPATSSSDTTPTPQEPPRFITNGPAPGGTNAVVPAFEMENTAPEDQISKFDSSTLLSTEDTRAPDSNGSMALGKRQAQYQPSAQRSSKRTKSNQVTLNVGTPEKGQKSLKGFFKPKVPENSGDSSLSNTDSLPAGYGLRGTSPQRVLSSVIKSNDQNVLVDQGSLADTNDSPKVYESEPTNTTFHASSHLSRKPSKEESQKEEEVVDPIVTKESWSKLFSKPVAPRCEGHNEPCIKLTTKKSGFNCGRAFWICPRPVGPSGSKEKGTEWRCQTFIWSSDWNARESDS